MRKFVCFGLLFCTLLTLKPLHATVVGIHGILVSFRSLYPIKKVLECTGEDVYLHRFDSRKACLQTHGDRLALQLQCIAAENPGQPIDFVAHSIGALVLRAALHSQYCPEEAKIGRAVLLAPTNHGSFLARKYRNVVPIAFVLGDKAGRELMTYTEADIISIFGSFPPTMQVLVVAGCKGIYPHFNGCPNDGYVAVEETYLNTPHIHRVLPVNHGEVLTNIYSLRLAREFLLYGCDANNN